MAKEGLLVLANYSKIRQEMCISPTSVIGLERVGKGGRLSLMWKICRYKIFQETVKSPAIQKYS